MTFAEKLRELRQEKELTQSGLADVSGLSLGAVRDYEQSKKEPSIASLSKLAAGLGVDMNTITDDVEWASREDNRQ